METKLTYDGYEGYVKVRLANNIERLEALDSLGFEVSDFDTEDKKLSKKDAANKRDKAEKMFSKFSVIANLIRMSEKHYLEVKLATAKKSYKSYDDLLDDGTTQEIMMNAATVALLSMGEPVEKK